MADTAPTPEEIAQAQAVLDAGRRDAENRSKARMAKMTDVIDAKTYNKLVLSLESVPEEILADPSISIHISALRAGLTGLRPAYV